MNQNRCAAMMFDTRSMTDLLREIIRIPSFSKEESAVCDLIASVMESRGIECHRNNNNLWSFNRAYDPAIPTLLLNSHIDTVRPSAGWSRDPFDPGHEPDTIYGLGSNDAGASAVTLLSVFMELYDRSDLKRNVCLALTAEEEWSGKNGIESILPQIGSMEFALVGEPTGMRMAIAEKGLLVIDCTAHGKSGHAARGEGISAIYKAMEDIRWFRDYMFEKISPTLGPVNMAVTLIESGTQHNVVPAVCRFTVDIRVTDCYTHEEILDTIRENIMSDAVPRSMRLRSSSINEDHPIVVSARNLGIEIFGSPTLSDQALIPAPSVKIGPGDSARSHTADEFIRVDEMVDAVAIYRNLLGAVL